MPRLPASAFRRPIQIDHYDYARPDGDDDEFENPDFEDEDKTLEDVADTPKNSYDGEAIGMKRCDKCKSWHHPKNLVEYLCQECTRQVNVNNENKNSQNITTHQPTCGGGGGTEQQTQQDQLNDQPEVGAKSVGAGGQDEGKQNKSGSRGENNNNNGGKQALDAQAPSQQITSSPGRAREISISNSNEFGRESAALTSASGRAQLRESLQGSGRSSAAGTSSSRQQREQPAPSSGASSSSLGSCKKFLIKKISSSNLRAFLGRRHRAATPKSKSRAARDTKRAQVTTSGPSSSASQVAGGGRQTSASRSEDNLWQRRRRGREQPDACQRHKSARDQQPNDQSVTNRSQGSPDCADLVCGPGASRADQKLKAGDHEEDRILFLPEEEDGARSSEKIGCRATSKTQKLRKSKTIASSGAEEEMAPPLGMGSNPAARIELVSAADGEDQDLKHEGLAGGRPGQQPAVLAEETNRSCCAASKRLRELTAHLEHGSVPRSVLYETLEFAASVLESITMDQVSRVSDEDDGDLSEVQSDAVPNEVRKWLETTFTRNSISQKRRTEDKLKFRSVANAIRAGIVVDKIYRRMSASTPFVSQEVSNLLKCIDEWSFNCFQVNQVSQGQVLKSVGYELFNRYGLMYKFKIPTTILKNFLTQVESGYTKHKNPYHNNLHAADVTQTVHYMLWQAGLTNWLTDLEIFATLLAAIIHDYLHTGTTNNFHVMSQSTTALVYNDRAVLENFHISQAFTLMRNEDCNILAGLSKDEYREFRSLVIDMVLATDMSSHFQQIKAMKNILNHSDNFNADKSKILSLVIHISDISHPAKEWELHSQWTGLLMEEFFRQGDREKELALECSPLCDRETTLVAESQLGFIEFIVSPSLEICGDVLDRVHYQMAEANTRPVLPASAKAASVVLGAVGGGPAKLAAITAGAGPSAGPASDDKNGAAQAGESAQQPATISELLKDQSSINEPGAPALVPVPPTPASGDTSTTTAAPRRQSMAARQPQQQQHQPPPPPSQQQRKRPSVSSAGSSSGHSVASSASSFASSFVSSETIASNLRKMIASSSASLSRKLNISTGFGQPSTPAPAPAAANHSSSSSSSAALVGGNRRPEQRITISATQLPATGGERTETVAEFEARQAQYRHPVIQCSSSSEHPPARPKSSMAGNRPSRLSGGGGSGEQPPSDSGSATTLGQQENQEQQEVVATTATTGQLVLKRSSAGPTLVAGGLGSRSAPPLQYFKIQRPWIACLERNKRMWRERALAEANKPPSLSAADQT